MLGYMLYITFLFKCRFMKNHSIEYQYIKAAFDKFRHALGLMQLIINKDYEMKEEKDKKLKKLVKILSSDLLDEAEIYDLLISMSSCKNKVLQIEESIDTDSESKKDSIGE